jgi:hypothetical protein
MINNIINLPGNIVRGTGNVVSGTLSSVASAAGVGRGSIRRASMDGEIVLPDKTNITVKV